MENNADVTPANEVKQEKKCRFPFFRKKWVRVTYYVLLYAFAIAGAAIIGAWAIFKLGLTNNSSTIARNTLHQHLRQHRWHYLTDEMAHTCHTSPDTYW